MNELYAIDPLAPKDIKDIKALFGKFGMANGRFIANFPKYWVSELLLYWDQFGQIERNKIVTLIQNNRDAFLNVDADYKKIKNWSENAAALKSLVGKISGVLASNPNSLNLPTLESYLWDGVDSNDGSRGGHIPMTVDAYLWATRPLLELSSEVHLTDSFFQLRDQFGNLDRRKCDFLSGLISLANQFERCEMIKIHFKRQFEIKEEVQEERCARDLATVLDRAGAIRCKFQFDLHEKMTHGRYIFSIKGGLQFDHGFAFNSGEKNHIHWLAKSELLPIQLKFGL